MVVVVVWRDVRGARVVRGERLVPNIVVCGLIVQWKAGLAGVMLLLRL